MSEPSEEIAVQLTGLRKSYALYDSIGAATRARMGQLLKLPHAWLPQPRLHHAVNDINLTVKRGERVGIVGRNGAGKTTLLKLVVGALAPTSGRVQVNGAIQTLMQTGLGFSQEQTGWNNIMTSLTLAGMPPEEAVIAQQEVADFAELGSHLHQPFRTYSAGMAARLQFATATSMKPDILVIDEVLGAGDTYFMLKCMKRMEDLAASGCTLLLVTHATQQLLHFCDRAVWIERGRLIMDSDAIEVTSAYDVHVQRMLAGATDAGMHMASDGDAFEGQVSPAEFSEKLDGGGEIFRWPTTEPLKVVDVRLGDQKTNRGSVRFGERLQIAFDLVSKCQRTYRCRYLLTFWTRRGERIARLENELDEFTMEALERREIVCWVPSIQLAPGEYLVTLSIYDFLDRGEGVPEGGTRVDFVVRAVVLEILGSHEGRFLIRQPMSMAARPHPIAC